MGYKFTQLTAPGSTSPLNVPSSKSHCCQYTVSNINTNVIVRFEGSIDSIDYFNLDGDGDTTITANGTYAFKMSNTPLAKVRFTFVSETGGTDADIDVFYEGD